MDIEQENKYTVSLSLNIASYDGSQGRLSSFFNKDFTAKNMSDLIRLLTKFDNLTEQLKEI